MKVEKEVTIYLEYFVDALEIIDKMNLSLADASIFMDEEKFFEGKCYITIDKTMFRFFPVHKLFEKKEASGKYKLTRYVYKWYFPVQLGEFDSIDEAKKAGQADMEKVFCGRCFTSMKEWKEMSYGFKNEAFRGDDGYTYVIVKKEEEE